MVEMFAIANATLANVIAIPCGLVTMVGFWLARRLGAGPSIATFISAFGVSIVLGTMAFPFAASCVAAAAGVSGAKSYRHFHYVPEEAVKE